MACLICGLSYSVSTSHTSHVFAVNSHPLDSFPTRPRLFKANVLRSCRHECCFDSSASSQNCPRLSHQDWLSASILTALSLHTEALTAADNKSKKERRKMGMLSNMSSSHDIQPSGDSRPLPRLYSTAGFTSRMSCAVFNSPIF